MTEGYESLSAEIYEGTGGYVRYFDISRILRWLDEHPDQVPGRTITESEFKHAARKNQIGDSFGCYEGFLDDLGITVAPDPEPTNAEKLEALYDQWLESDAPACRVSFHQFMDEAGVKAPGGNDD